MLLYGWQLRLWTGQFYAVEFCDGPHDQTLVYNYKYQTTSYTNLPNLIPRSNAEMGLEMRPTFTQEGQTMFGNANI